MGLFKTTRKKFNSLWFLHHYDVKFLNFTFYEGRKHKRKIFIFFRLNFNTPEKFAYIWEGLNNVMIVAFKWTCYFAAQPSRSRFLKLLNAERNALIP